MLNKLFIETQPYGNGVAVRVPLDKVELVDNIVHNFGDRQVMGARVERKQFNHQIPFVRFESRDQFVRTIALWCYTILSNKRNKSGFGKGRNLWREAQRIARERVAEIPAAKQSFVAGVRINTSENNVAA